MTPWKILVVDDDPDIRRIAALALERLGGFRVELAGGADEALELIAKELPDVVLLDVTMPGRDGPATLLAIREVPGAERIPVVFFTATSSAEEAERLCALGALGVVPKPFDLADLPRRIRDMVDRSGLH
jgi:two-component system OmpR family response regulator